MDWKKPTTNMTKSQFNIWKSSSSKNLLSILFFGINNIFLYTKPFDGLLSDLSNTITRKGSYLNCI